MHTALKACLKYRVKHRQPYRTRLKLPVLLRRDALCSQIEKLLHELSGVTGVEVHARTGSVILEHPGGLVEIAAVLEIIDEALARPVSPGNCSLVLPTKSTKCKLSGTDRSLKNTDKKNHVSGSVLVASGLYLLYLWMRHLFSAIATPVPISAVSRVTSLPALVALGLSIPIQRQAIQNLKRTGKPDIGILSTGLLYLSILFGNAVTALVVFWLFNLSGWLESRIRERTRTAVRAMLQQEVTEVWLVRDGVEIQVSVDELVPGDVISLRLGNTIPIDGTVVEGKALINESVMTGETFPSFRRKGDSVLAGTIIDEGRILVRVNSVGEETRLAAIIRHIEEAESGRAPLQVTSQRFSEAIVPVSLSLALGTFLLTGSLLRAMAVLIITCPCAIRISTSVAMSAAMGNAASRGILIKGGRYLELGGNVDVLVFDKTGTLTGNIPGISRVVTLDEDFEPVFILQLAASSQLRWKHPLTRAVVEKAKEMGVDIIPHDQTDVHIGQGVEARIGERDILVGSRQFLESRLIDFTAGDTHEKRMLGCGENVLYVACNHRLVGLIGVKDYLRSDTPRILQELRGMGVRHIVMLTGDGEQGAKAIAKHLSLDELHWSQSPEDKAAWITLWKKNHPHDVVAMVGDGINDTPAFACSDLSFAIGEGGADVAVEYADIVLQHGDLALVAETVGLGQKTVSVIRQDYAMAIGLNSVGLVMTTLGWITPFVGAFLHNVITLIVVSNSAKLLAYKKDPNVLAEKSSGRNQFYGSNLVSQSILS